MTSYSGANWSQDVLEEMLPINEPEHVDQSFPADEPPELIFLPDQVPADATPAPVEEEPDWGEGDPWATEPAGPWTGQDDEPFDGGVWGSGAADGPGPDQEPLPEPPYDETPDESPVVPIPLPDEPVLVPEEPPVEMETFEMPEEFHDAMDKLDQMDEIFAD